MVICADYSYYLKFLCASGKNMSKNWQNDFWPFWAPLSKLRNFGNFFRCTLVVKSMKILYWIWKCWLQSYRYGYFLSIFAIAFSFDELLNFFLTWKFISRFNSLWGTRQLGGHGWSCFEVVNSPQNFTGRELELQLSFYKRLWHKILTKIF
jgi:hypothetical protein